VDPDALLAVDRCNTELASRKNESNSENVNATNKDSSADHLPKEVIRRPRSKREADQPPSSKRGADHPSFKSIALPSQLSDFLYRAKCNLYRQRWSSTVRIWIMRRSGFLFQQSRQYKYCNVVL
jgi:hypothetical protein